MSTESEIERAYQDGRRATLSRLLMHFAGELYTTREEARLRSPEERLAFLEAERLDTISALRELCAPLGCNDWPDTLHLRDIIEKHLGRVLRTPLGDLLRRRANEALAKMPVRLPK